MRKSKTEQMVVLSLLAAIAYLLMFLEFPILPVFDWLKLDFSDIPVLIGTFIYGPIGGILTAFIRSTLKFITSGGNIASLVGNGAGFLASVMYLLPTYYMIKRKHQTSSLIVGLSLGTLLMTIFMSIANYYVITPFYLNVMGFDFGIPIGKMILMGIVPFNLIKGLIVSIAFVAVFKKLFPLLEKRMSVAVKQFK